MTDDNRNTQRKDETMTTYTRTREDIMADIEDAIRETMIADMRNGANDYAYVRVWPDGSVTSGREPSRCIPESEYFAREPHCVTVWSAQGIRPAAGPDDGVFAWDACEAADEGAFERDGEWYRLSDELVDPLDIDELLREIESTLDQHEWIPA